MFTIPSFSRASTFFLMAGIGMHLGSNAAQAQSRMRGVQSMVQRAGQVQGRSYNQQSHGDHQSHGHQQSHGNGKNFSAHKSWHPNQQQFSRRFPTSQPQFQHENSRGTLVTPSKLHSQVRQAIVNAVPSVGHQPSSQLPVGRFMEQVSPGQLMQGVLKNSLVPSGGGNPLASSLKHPHSSTSHASTSWWGHALKGWGHHHHHVGYPWYCARPPVLIYLPPTYYCPPPVTICPAPPITICPPPAVVVLPNEPTPAAPVPPADSIADTNPDATEPETAKETTLGPVDLKVEYVELIELQGDETGSGPLYRIWIYNAGPAPISQPFDLAVIATNGDRPEEDSPFATVRVTKIDPDARLSVEIRLPAEVLQMGIDTEGITQPFRNLFVAVDALAELQETNEENNALAISRTAIPASDALVAAK
ncbi:MAG: hypothetical protein O2931_13645 [Planctomycetota bacterium]|nr:hypothetical protein [Planctomycetota bacterium]MDA1179828.1 hypothetical protein [Planctomycetota bacterium]